MELKAYCLWHEPGSPGRDAVTEEPSEPHPYFPPLLLLLYSHSTILIQLPGGRYSIRSFQSQSPPSLHRSMSNRACFPYATVPTERRNRITPACPTPSRVSVPACNAMLARSNP